VPGVSLVAVGGFTQQLAGAVSFEQAGIDAEGALSHLLASYAQFSEKVWPVAYRAANGRVKQRVPVNEGLGAAGGGGEGDQALPHDIGEVLQDFSHFDQVIGPVLEAQAASEIHPEAQ